jgi:hypothetical protein
MKHFISQFISRFPDIHIRLARLYEDIARTSPNAEMVNLREKAVRRIQSVEGQVQRIELSQKLRDERPIIYLVASGHTTVLGNMGAFGLICSWALRVAGYRVIYYVCERGMSQCVIGANREMVYTQPDCRSCIEFRRAVYPDKHTSVLSVPLGKHSKLRKQLNDMPLEKVESFSYKGLPIGQLCLPSLRWVERRCNPAKNEFTRLMMRDFVTSAVGVCDDFLDKLAHWNPLAIVMSNGTHYPEAVVREAAAKKGVRVYSHELGFRKNSAFFSEGIAVKYEIHVPDDFIMGDLENICFDKYMEGRIKGKCAMGGVKIWPRMEGVSSKLADKISLFPGMVTVFTNVGYDTSQGYCDAFFKNSFDWLDETMHIAASHPETLFVVRAHPVEERQGRQSNESVAVFMADGDWTRHDNIMFIRGSEYISSYELIRRSRFCLVYSSQIGLEGAAMGSFVLPGGKTRYRHAKVCYRTASRDDYTATLESLLSDSGFVIPPQEWVSNARRFLYFSIFYSSLDLSEFMDSNKHPKYYVTSFEAEKLRGEHNESMKTICDGIVKGKPFYLPYAK